MFLISNNDFDVYIQKVVSGLQDLRRNMKIGQEDLFQGVGVVLIYSNLSLFFLIEDLNLLYRYVYFKFKFCNNNYILIVF